VIEDYLGFWITYFGRMAEIRVGLEWAEGYFFLEIINRGNIYKYASRSTNSGRNGSTGSVPM
jgi:hypothetical protein